MDAQERPAAATKPSFKRPSTALATATATRNIAVAVATVITLVTAIVLWILHDASADPGSALRPPYSDENQVNGQITRRSAALVSALRAGDTKKMKALTWGGEDHSSVDAFTDAFGRRQDVIASLKPSDMDNSIAVLLLTVPCKGGGTQTAIVDFVWKRTSFISSGWYAAIDPPGTPDAQPTGCPAP